MALEQFFGRIVDLVRRTDGDELTAAAGIAETVLHIGDTADFDETGGLVEVNGDRYTYSEVDPDAATITLDTGLLVAAAVGDRVDVVDEELDQVVVEYVSHVLLEDQDPGDQPIEVTVNHGLVNYLSESVRGGSTESVTLMRDGDDDMVVWQVDGKLVVDIALEQVQGGYNGTLQDIYDAANEAAAAAAEAEYTATVAQSTADGKNTVTYSNSTPGSTPNKAGDIWFQRDGTPSGGIIAQFEGQGGTSWASRALRNEVIANLDAGKITAGTAFTNALHVKTNFTLGDAAVNGIIQSYNFAGSPVGVFIDKNGLVAKGGSVAGAEITGGTVTGATVQTSTSPTVGVKMDGTGIRAYSGGYAFFNVNFGSGLVSTYGQMLEGAPQLLGAWLKNDTTIDHVVGGLSVNGGVDINSGGLDVTGGGINVTSGTSGFYDGCSISGGLTVNSGGILAGGQIEFNSLEGTGGSSFVMVGNDGVLSRGAPSSLRYKENVKPLDTRVADALLQVDTITWQYKDRKTHGDRRYAGVPAEQLHDLGLNAFVDYDDKGRPDQVRYWELTAPLIALCQSQQAQINDMAARLEAAGL